MSDSEHTDDNKHEPLDEDAETIENGIMNAMREQARLEAEYEAKHGKDEPKEKESDKETAASSPPAKPKKEISEKQKIARAANLAKARARRAELAKAKRDAKNGGVSEPKPKPAVKPAPVQPGDEDTALPVAKPELVRQKSKKPTKSAKKPEPEEESSDDEEEEEEEEKPKPKKKSSRHSNEKRAILAKATGRSYGGAALY